jgi:hypothetical protein
MRAATGQHAGPVPARELAAEVTSPASSDVKVASLGALGSTTTAHAYHPPSTPFPRRRTRPHGCRSRASSDRGANAQLLAIGLRIFQLWSVDECSLQLTSSVADLLLDRHLVGIIFFLGVQSLLSSGCSLFDIQRRGETSQDGQHPHNELTPSTHTHKMIWIDLNTGGGDEMDGRGRRVPSLPPVAVSTGPRVHAIHGSLAMVTVRASLGGLHPRLRPQLH